MPTRKRLSVFNNPHAKRRFVPLAIMAALIILLWLAFSRQPLATGTMFALGFLGSAYELFYHFARRRRDNTLEARAHEISLLIFLSLGLVLVSLIAVIENHLK